jgi:hypothetical protein
MFDEVPAETIYSQIDHVLGQLTREADRLVLATCGPEEGAGPLTTDERDELSDIGAAHLVVGAVRTAGRVQGKVLETRAATVFVPESEYLRSFYRETVKPYLKSGSASGSALGTASRTAIVFQDARTRVPAAAHPAVAALEGMVEQRRQLDDQSRIQFWLHNWLWVHLPLSVALIVLMFVHVFFALKYM